MDSHLFTCDCDVLLSGFCMYSNFLNYASVHVYCVRLSDFASSRALDNLPVAWCNV